MNSTPSPQKQSPYGVFSELASSLQYPVENNQPIEVRLKIITNILNSRPEFDGALVQFMKCLCVLALQKYKNKLKMHLQPNELLQFNRSDADYQYQIIKLLCESLRIEIIVLAQENDKIKQFHFKPELNQDQNLLIFTLNLLHDNNKFLLLYAQAASSPKKYYSESTLMFTEGDTPSVLPEDQQASPKSKIRLAPVESQANTSRY